MSHTAPWHRGRVSYMNSLESVFGELGISQYLGIFVDQGFDSWETILDITESDLDALGVKLGHRRKLQRRIANYRGVAPDVSLVSPTRTSIEDGRHDSNRTDVGKADAKPGPTVTKRKYRRHPKPDANAPERPPSAYVLFSNKMREDLKGQNLTFTEIAKLVGENWQNLDRAEKEPFESQANEAKDRYTHDLAEYKKTPACMKYNEYLREFRKRQAIQQQGTSDEARHCEDSRTNSRLEKESAKRLKTSAESTRGSSTSVTSVGQGGTTSGTGSGSESQHGSEPPPSRHQRLSSMTGSAAGAGQSENHSTSPISMNHEDFNKGRLRGITSPHFHDVSAPIASNRVGWMDGQLLPGDATNAGIPWLDPRASSQPISGSPEGGAPGIHPGRTNQASRLSRESGSSGSRSFSQTPSLRHEPSSHGSMSSSTSPYIPRTPSDASLPIHALLSSKPEPTSQYGQASQTPSINGQASQIPASGYPAQSGWMSGSFPGTPQPSNIAPGPVPGHRATYPGTNDLGASATRHGGNSEGGLDGISALLKAREIVDRRP
ncbi:hypothetical protein F4808DRAFT_166274 [Astrocystis sublimbata]|nr:hypothetical protein F4808DRAFT_166274 [Astrocystis sublimbata]